MSDNRSAGMGKRKENEGCSFSGFSFSAFIISYFFFESQNEGCYKYKTKRFFWQKINNKTYVRACALYSENIYKITNSCMVMALMGK